MPVADRLALPHAGTAATVADGAAARARLPAGIEAVYAEHFALVWRSLRRLGVADDQLEDAAQDVFLVVHRRWRDFEGRSALTTWIYGIALRVAKDHRRAEARHASRVERWAELGAPVASADARTPADEAERREANRVLHAALGAMSGELREVLVLVDLEQVAVREAAAALGIHVRACQRRLRAARAAFEAELRKLTTTRAEGSKT